MKSLVNTRWFALADLGCVMASAVWWLSQPMIGGWPLFVALLPWMARLTAGQFPFRRTPLDWFMALFLLSAGVGVWVAYDREGAWIKFWVLVSATLFYFAMSAQPRTNIWLIVRLMGGIGVGMAGYFLLTNDWRGQPVKFEIIQRIGLWWMSVRPAVPAPPIHPNDVAYLIVMMTPFVAAGVLRAKRDHDRIGLGVAGAALCLVVISLLLTLSRGGWVALGSALGIWLLWRLSNRVAVRSGQPPSLIFALLLFFLAAGASAGVAWATPGGPGMLFSRLLSPVNGVSRLDLQLGTLPLVNDFLFTGGGLRAFPGLYSRYMLVIPDFFLVYSHNLFLDIVLEQGILGLLAFLGIMIGSVWQLIGRSGLVRPNVAYADVLRWATASSWIAIAVHGLVDDTLYGDQSTPILFWLAGLCVALTQVEERHQIAAREGARSFRWSGGKLAGVAALAFVAFGLVGFRQIWLSSWYANQGAVEMARVELAGWPEMARWQTDYDLAELAPAEVLFKQSLQLDPSNVTANYRLGLIAAKGGNETEAIARWAQANQTTPNHRGIRKVLGYAYVWQGQFDRAAGLLDGIAEAKSEMDTYSWWWGTQGRDDLAANAAQMAKLLAGQ
jgi:hypothetical protein